MQPVGGGAGGKSYRGFTEEHVFGANGEVVGAESIDLRADTARAVLLLHGFNDTPQSVSTLAHALHAAGWSVRAPLLPAHGRGLVEAAGMSAEVLLEFALAEYAKLAGECASVAVCGQSMGGALAVQVAVRHPEVRSLALLAPYLGMTRELRWQLVALRLVQPFVPWIRSRGGEESIHDPEARRRALGGGAFTAGMLVELKRVATDAARVLPELRVPTLYLQSREDNRIRESDALRHFAMVGSPVKEQCWLTGCGHVIAEDYCRQEVACAVVEWIERFDGTGGLVSVV